MGLRWAELLVKKPNQELSESTGCLGRTRKANWHWLARVICAKTLDYMVRYPSDYELTSAMHVRASTMLKRKSKGIDACLEKLLSSTDATPACFAYYLYSIQDRSEKFESECDKILQKCVERWPRCSFPHRVMMELLTASDNPNPNECYPYLKQLPRILPASIARPNGFQPSCMSSRLNEDWFIREGLALSPAQLFALVEEIFSNESLPPWKFEPWLFVGASQIFIQNAGYNRGLGIKMYSYE